MRRISNLLAWGALLVVAALIVLNWSTLMVSASFDLVVAKIQAPVGAVMLVLAAVLLALFFVAYVQNLIGSLLETRGLLKEVQRVQELADKAEASRIESLRQVMMTEFGRLNERLDAAAQTPPPPEQLSGGQSPASNILPPPM